MCSTETMGTALSLILRKRAGVTNPSEGRGMAAIACDYDNDGFPDVYVANDTNRNFMYRNNGDRHLHRREPLHRSRLR